MQTRWIRMISVAVVPLLAIAACSSSRSNIAQDEAAPATPSAVSAAPNQGTALVESAAFGQDADGARVVLNADSPILYTSYEPRPDTLILDLPGVRIADNMAAPSVSGDLVTSIALEPMTELGKVQSRVTIKHRPGIKYEVASQGRSLAIGFEDPKAVAAASIDEPARPAVVTATELPAGTPSAMSADNRSVEAPASTPASQAAALPPVPAGQEKANALEKINVSGSGETATVVLLGDGALSARDFVLPNPPRIVLDLSGVRSEIKSKSLPGAGPVLRARVSQYQVRPEKVARVVIDLDRIRPYTLERDGERLLIHFGNAVTSTTEAARTEPSRTEIAAQSSPAPAEVAAQPPPRPVEEPKSEEAVSAAKPAASPAPAPSNDTTNLTALATRPPENQIPPERRAKGVLEARRVPRPASKPAAEKTDKEILFESAEAMLNEQEGSAASKQELSNTYKSKTVGGGESQYTGEPISLDLKDADIKDVFRTISELTGLNIVIDPDVRGTVTVRLENVPWDQALELILKQNGLSFVLDNNVMRIATTAKLQSEENQQADLLKSREASTPTKTVIKKLSYADAGQTADTLKKIMSPRGDIIVDKRTNTLVIKEIPDYMPTVIQLAENLDTPTPQVVIESRIVETTKSFGRQLGINWGFTGVSDAAHGNTTNLDFPNNGSLAGTVGLEAAAPNSLALRLGNILDTFNLDMALTAAENQGLVKIISSPKVEAMTNESAYVQTGLQIPVQTVVNNTTTVVYIDATLRLDVVPQITAEGTVLMDVKISKRQPAPGVQIQGGGNVPLSIREAKTKVIVKDGGTAVIGGIFQMNDQDNYNYVPGLWKIPLLGNLFKNTNVQSSHDELLIFMTPRIVH